MDRAWMAWTVARARPRGLRTVSCSSQPRCLGTSSETWGDCAKCAFVPDLASMSDRHDIPALPEPLLSEISDDELRVGMPEEPPTAFQLIWVPSLTRRTVDEVVDRAKHALQPRIFVSYARVRPKRATRFAPQAFPSPAMMVASSSVRRVFS